MGGVDIPFVLLLLAVVIVGLIMLFSASYTAAYYKYNDAYHFIGRQAAFTLVGLVIMWVVSRVPYQILHQLSFPSLAAALVLLVLVLFIGTTNNTEAKRWLVIGPINFQPSEIAKAAIIIVFSSLAVRMRSTIKNPSSLIPFLVILGFVAILLLRQPHLSATIIVILSGMIVMFLGGANILHLGSLAAVGITGVYILVFKFGYQYDRIESWLDPWKYPLGDGFQLLQSLYAVGSGGLWGLGLGQSRQKQMYLPEPYNDFIYSIVCEELGFIGAALIIVLFAALYIRGFYIALKSRDTFGTLLVAGFISQLALQTFLNIGVVIGLLPVTGASLPFFSSGGTSLLVLYAEMGVVLGVSRQMAGNEKSQ
ncbi:MAG: putative lipid II flippase FtsW [Clostridia bacterium]|nr:putative lipid II flippase FtsW [Clostridia bacterium]